MSRPQGDHWERLQIILRNRGAKGGFGGFGGLPGGGKGGFRVGGLVLVLGLGGLAFSESLFNGQRERMDGRDGGMGEGWQLMLFLQWTAVTARSSTLG